MSLTADIADMSILVVALIQFFSRSTLRRKETRRENMYWYCTKTMYWYLIKLKQDSMFHVSGSI